MINVTTSAFAGIRLLVLNADPVMTLSAGEAILYALDNGDGTASLRILAGTSPTPLDVAVNLGAGVAAAH